MIFRHIGGVIVTVEPHPFHRGYLCVCWETGTLDTAWTPHAKHRTQGRYKTEAEAIEAAIKQCKRMGIMKSA